MNATAKLHCCLRPIRTGCSPHRLTRRSPQPRDPILRRPSRHPLEAADLTTTILPTVGYLACQDERRTRDMCDSIHCSTNGSKDIQFHSYQNASLDASQGDGF